MALPADTAIVPTKQALGNPQSFQSSPTSTMPMNATVEEYTSDEGSVLREGRQHQRVLSAKKGTNEQVVHQLKPTIRRSTSPKQASVSWFDDPLPQNLSQRSSESRRSGFSEATTAVPSGAEPFERPPIGESRRDRYKPPKDYYFNPDHRKRPDSRSRDAQIHDDYHIPQSIKEGAWYDRRELHQLANTVPHSQPQYLSPIKRVPWTFNEDDIAQQIGNSQHQTSESYSPFHPAYPEYLRHDMAHTHHQPRSQFFGNPYVEVPQYSYGQPGYPNSYGSAFCRNHAYPEVYRDYEAASQGRGRHARTYPYHTPITQPQYHYDSSKEETKMSAKLEGVLQNTSQVLDQHSEARSGVQEVEPIATPQTETTLSDLDLVKILGERMLDLKRKNEEKLMVANQVLEYLRPNTEKEQRSDDEESDCKQPDSARHSYIQVPRVYYSRASEYEPSHESVSGVSDNGSQGSIAGNSSGSSISSIATESRHVRYKPEIAGHQYDHRSTDSETIDSEDDASTASTESDVETSRHRAKSGNSNLGVVQGVIDTAPGHDAVHSAAIVRTQLEMMGELIALRQDLSTLQQQTIKVNKSWLVHAACSLFAKVGRHFRPVLQPGSQRLEWACECGEDMYADLPIQNGSQYQQMLDFLTKPGPRVHQAKFDPTPSQLERGTTPMNGSSLNSNPISSSQHLSPSSTFGSGSTFVGTDTSQTLSPPQSIFSAQSKYLELCVNVNKYETKLAEIQVLSGQTNGAAICTDAHLFRQIYEHYYALRKHNWRRFLYRPAGIKFVHFGVQTGARVSFFSSDPLPPEDVVTAKRYEYNPQPPVPPPIDSRTFLHYFHKHSAHSHSTSAKYVDRLPKKLGDSLTRSLGADDLLEGWGVHIIEGPNKVAICWALMAVLAASLAVSIVYDYLSRSGESGFAIGQWMVAALTVGLSALYFSLEDDVNTSFD